MPFDREDTDMGDNESNRETRGAPPEALVYCPTCGVDLPAPSPTVLVAFSSVGVSLDPSGGLNWGDAFLDYEHADCGTSVRLLVHKTWDNDVFEYVMTNDVHLEVYDQEQRLVFLDGQGEFGLDGRQRFFSGNVRDDLDTWDRTLQSLLASLSYALENVHLISKGVAE